MINFDGQMPLSAFMAYDPHLRMERSHALVFLSDQERRRFLRYDLLFSMFHNFSEQVAGRAQGIEGSKEVLDSARSYGESALVTTAIRDAMIAGAVDTTDNIDPRLLKAWTDGDIKGLITRFELDTGMTGDGFLHLYLRRPGQWRVEQLKPGQVVIQAYDREMRHVVIWKWLPPQDRARRVWTLEYRLVPSGDDFVCEVREMTWKIASKRSLTPGLPFDFGLLVPAGGNLLLKQPIGSESVPEPLSWAPFILDGGKQADFIPVIHFPNIGSLEVYGFADTHKALDLLLDLGMVNRRINTGSRLLALPPVGVETEDTNFSDMKPQSLGADGSERLEERELRPGTILGGKVYLVDTSKLFESLLQAKRHFYQTLFAVSQTPEVALNPTELRVTSGAALRVMFQPLINLVRVKRTERAGKYSLLLKFLMKAMGIPAQEQMPEVLFGDIEKWIDTKVDELLAAVAAGVISKKEARTHFVKGQVLERGLLDSEFDPDARRPAAVIDLATAVGNATTPAE